MKSGISGPLVNSYIHPPTTPVVDLLGRSNVRPVGGLWLIQSPRPGEHCSGGDGYTPEVESILEVTKPSQLS
jgi:hypothetical protein